MKILKHLVDAGVGDGIILKYILKVYIQTSSGAPPPSSSEGTRISFPGAKLAGA
jgi:hypothetical protein